MMRTHRPCFYLSILMALGIFLGHAGFFSWMCWSILCGFFLSLSLFIPRASKVFLSIGIVCLGAFYEQHSFIHPADHIAFLSYEVQKNIDELEGVIDSEIQLKPTNYGTKQVFELEVKRIKVENEWRGAQGKILVNCFKSELLNYGDRIRIEGFLFKAKQNEGERFSYQQYLEDHNLFFIYSVANRKSLEILSVNQGSWWLTLAIKVKNCFRHSLEQYLEPQELSMIQAMTLGDRSFLSKDMYALFSKTGTSHILAISGMNMAVIGGMFLFILKVICIPRRLQFILTAIFLILYAVLCGWSASVVRSVIMAAVLLSSFCVEYESEGLNSLGFAALVLFVISPSTLFDIGFQLSFICVGMIMLIYPSCQEFNPRELKNKFLKHILQAFCISLIAWIGITPLIAYHFQIVSLISILANIPVVVLADLVIVLSLCLVMFGLCFAPLAFAFAACLKAVFNLLLLLVFTLANLPGAYFYIQDLPLYWVITYYFVLLALILGWASMRKRYPRLPRLD